MQPKETHRQVLLYAAFVRLSRLLVDLTTCLPEFLWIHGLIVLCDPPMSEVIIAYQRLCFGSNSAALFRSAVVWNERKALLCFCRHGSFTSLSL